MSTQGKTFAARSSASRVLNASGGAAATVEEPSLSPPADRLLHRKYRELIRKHLGRFLDRLFAEFTGLHFHIAWASASPDAWEAERPPTGCSVCCKLTGSPLPPECRACGPKRLAATLKSDHGHRFTCPLGVRNHWFPVRLRGDTAAIAYLQALEAPPRGFPDRKDSARTRDGRSGLPGEAIVVGPVEFARAARLLRLIVEHAQTASLSELRKADLTCAGRAVVALGREQARLRATLQRHLPLPTQTPRTSLQSHGEQIVHGLLERVELDYAKPITLRRFARELGMNNTYLSALFSRAMGIPFKAYLTELRLRKAKELLGDGSKTISEVGFAVGYSSGERFRCAFRKANGLSPKVWRETMQTKPSGEAA